MINPDTGWPNRHTGYLAMSGYGKSQALLNNTEINSKSARVLLWDIDEDHRAYHYDDRLAYAKALQAAVRRGGGFRLAWAGDDSIATFEWWCGLVLKVLDGRKQTFVIIEELAEVSETAGKASPCLGRLLRGGRKYGAVVHWTTQRSQEISKTVYSQSPVKFIGYPNEGANVKLLAAYCGRSESELLALEPLQFFEAERGKSEFRQFKYKKIRR